MADDLTARCLAEIERAMAQEMCDSSSHINLLPHADQRPCEYHKKRAAACAPRLARMMAAGVQTAGLAGWDARELLQNNVDDAIVAALARHRPCAGGSDG